MDVSTDEASKQALAFVRERFHDSIQLVPVNSLPSPVYGFDPTGWYLFEVSERTPSSLGGSEYVAVSRSTSEVLLLGRIGD